MPFMALALAASVSLKHISCTFLSRATELRCRPRLQRLQHTQLKSHKRKERNVVEASDRPHMLSLSSILSLLHLPFPFPIIFQESQAILHDPAVADAPQPPVLHGAEGHEHAFQVIAAIGLRVRLRVPRLRAVAALLGAAISGAIITLHHIQVKHG